MSKPAECETCGRPTNNLKTLYYRDRNGRALLVGRFGRKCFYRIARTLFAQGFQPEHQDARPIFLRGRP